MRVFLPVLFLLHLALALWVRPVTGERLQGPDAYMRLNRVHHLVDSGSWTDSHFPRSNAPHGENLHWTRPFDVVLLALAVPALPFMSFDRALYWAGVLVSPLLHLLALLALVWAVRPVVSRAALFWVAALFVAQPAVLPNVGAGRADHHALLLLLFVFWLGMSLRLIIKPFDSRRCIGAGALAALCLWVSSESLLFVSVTFAVLAGVFVTKKSTTGVVLLHTLRAFAGGLWLCLIAERGVFDVTIEYDRISLVHAAIASVAFVLWAAILWRLRWRASLMQRVRLWLIVGWAAGVLGFVALVFPRFFGGPMVDVDPELAAVWLDVVIEAQPLLAPGDFLWALGPVVIALPFLLWATWKNRSWLGRSVAAYLLFATVVHVAAAVYQARFAMYVVVLCTVPVSLFLVRQLARCQQLSVAAVRGVAKGGVVVVVLFGFSIVAALFMTVGAPPSEKSCDLHRVAGTLDAPTGLGDRTRTILAFVDLGPELMYRTRHRVVATPYHRNADGILDAVRAFSANTDAAARAIIDAREVDLLLMCLRPGEKNYYQRAATTGSTFYQRVIEGRGPAWLRRLPVSPVTGTTKVTAAEIALFEIVR